METVMERKWILAMLCAAIVAAVGLALAAGIIWPEASGTAMTVDGKLTVDWSGAQDGYIMACAEPAGKPYKLRVKFGDVTLTYLLNEQGSYEVFPLQFGSGQYTVSLYENTTGKKYASVGAARLDVTLTDEAAAFLVPSQMVNYTRDTEAVAIARTLCEGLQTDREKFEAVRSYVRTNYSYDFVRTFSVTGDFLPDIDYCTANRSGVYLDLAAMAACMLRTQGIPVQLAVGQLDKSEHAWTIVLLDGREVLYDPAAEIGGVRGVHYTVERIY